MLLTNPSNSNCFKASLIGVLEIFSSLERTTSFNFCPFSYSSFKILSLKIQKMRCPKEPCPAFSKIIFFHTITYL